MRPDATGLRWGLFLALALVWPLPLLGLEGSFVPLARFVQLAASLGVLLAIEGGGGMVSVLLALFLGHVVVYGLVLFAAAWGVVRLTTWRLSTPGALGVVIALVLGVVVWSHVVAPYDTAFHHSDAHASLWRIYR